MHRALPEAEEFWTVTVPSRRKVSEPAVLFQDKVPSKDTMDMTVPLWKIGFTQEKKCGRALV